MLGFKLNKTLLRLSSPGADPSLGVGCTSQNDSTKNSSIVWGAPLKVQKNNFGTLTPASANGTLTDTYKEKCKYHLFKKYLKVSHRKANVSGMYHRWGKFVLNHFLLRASEKLQTLLQVLSAA